MSEFDPSSPDARQHLQSLWDLTSAPPESDIQRYHASEIANLVLGAYLLYRNGVVEYALHAFREAVEYASHWRDEASLMRLPPRPYWPEAVRPVAMWLRGELLAHLAGTLGKGEA